MPGRVKIQQGACTLFDFKVKSTGVVVTDESREIKLEVVTDDKDNVIVISLDDDVVKSLDSLLRYSEQ